MEDISGIGFKTADKLANKLNFDQNSIHRKEAVLINLVLEHGSNTGDSYIDRDALLNSYLKLNLEESLFMEALMNVLMRRSLVMEYDFVYHYTQYDSEKTIASALNLFPNQKLAKASEQQVMAYIKLIEDEIGIVYDESQKSAIKKFLDADLSILTGGPGTGKTTIIREIGRAHV